MHEIGMSEAIVDEAVHRAAGRRVSRIRVRVGMGHAVDPAAIESAFQMAAAGTVAERARMDLVVEPIRFRCAACGAGGDVTEPTMAAMCPRCLAVDVEVLGADRVVLESIALERPIEEE
jgi:hydrogenase nickel incorporation protein HypA/HybF